MNNIQKVASAKTLALGLLGGGLGGLIGSRTKENAGRNALILGLMGAGAGSLGRLGFKGGGKGGDWVAEKLRRPIHGQEKWTNNQTTRQEATRLLRGKVPINAFNDYGEKGDKIRQILAGAAMLAAQGSGRALGTGAGIVGGGIGGGMLGSIIGPDPDNRPLLKNE